MTAFGYESDFIDGHEHIHQLPIIREALLTVLQKRYSNQSSKKPWIRTPVRPTCTVGWPSPIKCVLLENLGGIALQQSLTKASWPHRANFLGIYHYRFILFRNKLSTTHALLACCGKRTQANTVADLSFSTLIKVSPCLQMHHQ